MLFKPAGKSRETLIRNVRRPIRSGRRLLSLFVLLLAVPWQYADEEPQHFETEHLDLRLVYRSANPDNSLGLELYDYDHGRTVAPSNAVIVVRESARFTLPGGTEFGNAGDPLWILPQSQQPDLAYLGISAEQISGALFADPMTLALISMEGPGHFYLWQANQFGALEVKMNSRDGIDGQDRTTPLIGSHEHMNWGFSTNGIYRVTLQASGRENGKPDDTTGLPEVLTFHVLPLPEPVETPFARWQRAQFGEAAANALKTAGADPDSDGLPNVLEYAFGSNPNSASTGTLPVPVLVEDGGQTRLIIRFKRVSEAADLRYVVESAEVLEQAIWDPVALLTAESAPGSLEWVEIADARPVVESSRRFYRIKVQLIQPGG